MTTRDAIAKARQILMDHHLYMPDDTLEKQK